MEKIQGLQKINSFIELFANIKCFDFQNFIMPHELLNERESFITFYFKFVWSN